MFGGGLSAADLAHKRPEKKHKDKEAKDKKEWDSHVDSPVGDSGDVYEPTHIANLVGRTVSLLIDDVVVKQGAKLEEQLAKVIKAKLLNMQSHSEYHYPFGKLHSQHFFGQKAIPTEPSDAQTSDSPQQVKPAFVQPQVDKVINMMISEIEGLTELEEVVPPDDTTNLPLCREADEDHDSNIEDAANTQMDIESSSPLGGQNTNSTHEQLSPVREELSQCENEVNHRNSRDEVQRTELIPETVPALVANDDIGETRVFIVGNGLSVTTDELNDIVDRTKQMPPKVMDALMHYIALDRKRKRIHSSKITIYDTNFPALLMKQHARLVNTAAKDRSRLKYDEAVLKYFIPPTSSVDAYERIYFPFSIDKQHWIGKDLNPITIVVPHILNTATGNLGANQRKPYQMIRVKDVPQNHNSTDAAATTVLLIQANAASDGDGCKEITRDFLAAGTKHLAVLVYRDVTPV
ncbi:hypothetical protein DY000_02004754 [Brassica cretica]|uniref:Ubiquitin-like protease family profile domain-containing protein n=1 Tax=Brassica cretica TaxID=69181 RepID=A0ABQ7C8P1_BRACR|nr:hypothetical protein DY000_02004754 [Brassica cretica]